MREVRWSAKWGGNWYGIGTDNSSPYSMSWNMCNSGVPNGDVELGFEVWDNANNKWVYSENGHTNIHINKNYTCNQTSNDTTPPTGSWTNPGNGSTINSSTVTLNVNASDNSGGSGVREVRWSALFNGQWSGIGNDSTYPYSMDWNMCNSGVPNGDVELGMEVWDNANNVWIYSQHYTNIHINKNYTCGGNDGGGDPLAGGTWNTQAWQNRFMAGFTNWEGTFSWGSYPYISFDWGTGAPFGWGGNEFSMRLWRNVYFPGGYYSFMTQHDDGIKVYLDGTLIIDAWWDGSGGHDAGRNVSEGYHEVKVEYYENQGDAKLQVVWYGPGYPAPDNNPPDGRITSPAHLSASNNDSMDISADAWDDASGVDRVDFYAFYCLGSCTWRLINTDYSAPYTIDNWPWSVLSDQHMWFKIDVYDKTGKVRYDAGGWVEVDLDRGNPTASITSPAANSYLNTNSIPINVNASDSGSGVWKVQFFAGYNEMAGAGAQGEIAPPLPYLPDELQDVNPSEATAQDYWHEIGWDENGSNGWSFTWNAASVPDQGGASIFIYAYDKAGNYQGVQSWPIMLDRVKPSSAINILAQYTGATSFSVSWTGTDATSGIANYDIQYQDNGGAWTNWLSATTSTSANFNGTLNHTYTFRSRARDRAGNVEDWPHRQIRKLQLFLLHPITPLGLQSRSQLYLLFIRWTRAAQQLAADDPTSTCGYGKNSNSVWYKYVAPANGLLEVDTWGSDFDTVLAVWRGSIGNLTLVDCIDDNYGYFEAWLEETPVTTGITYYIEVMDYGNPGGGNLELYVNFAQSQPNNDFNTPTIINALPYSVTQSTRGATQANDDPTLTSCNRLPGQASVWYRYTPSANANLLLDTKGSDYDTMLAVWTGSRGNLVSVGCNDDIGDVNGTWDSDSILSVPVTAGINYYVEASTFDGRIDINGASAMEVQNKPDNVSNEDASVSSLQDEKTNIDNNGGLMTGLQSERPEDISAQFWGGTLKLHVSVIYSISGNAGVAGATLNYTDGTPKTATANGSGNYSISVPSGWTGTVTPYQTGYTFTPVSRSYANVQSNQTAQNYTTQVCANCANVNTYIGGNLVGAYSVSPASYVSPRYGINGGPVKVSSTNALPIFSSQRAIYGSSFNSIVGYPADQLTTDYWFTSYDDLGMITYLVIGNPHPSNTALVDVYIGGNKMNATPYSIAPGQRIFPRYGINAGPVHIVSTNGIDIFTSERTKFGQSFNEVMGYPGNQLTTDYWFTSYDDVGMITYLVIGNPHASNTAEVDVYINGNKMNAAPYSIAPGQRIFPRYAINAGPVQVVSTNGVDIFTSERSKFGNSFNEVMGYPGDQLTTDYWFSSYDDASMITYLVIGNPHPTLTAEVDVYINGIKKNATPYIIAPGQRVFPRYAINSGPVHVVSTNGVDIFTSERAKYLNSFNEILGLANNQLTTDYWFTSYDDLGMITNLVIAAP